MGRRLLIVDDDARVTELLCRYLSSVGYDTRSSQDAMSAIALIRENLFDLLVVDSLPNLASRDVILKFREKNPKAPVILFTGNVSSETLRVALEAGANLLLEKPLGMPEFSKEVERLLQAAS
ncbi:MAG TPA: response regulator [Terriglobales bacterium]|nr:response regulator [Terriglobales bacterium]